MNITTFSDPKATQFSQIDFQEAIALYQKGQLTAKGLIIQAVKIYRKVGQTLNISLRWLRERLGVPRSTFYKALASLKREGEIEQISAVTVSGLRVPGGRCGEEQTVSPAAVDFAQNHPPVEGLAACQSFADFKKLSPELRGKFEQFVRREWRRMRGQEIFSFHRFLSKAGDFAMWRDRFLAEERKEAARTAAAAPAAAAPVAAAPAAAAPAAPINWGSLWAAIKPVA